jgi:hypothetical protein
VAIGKRLTKLRKRLKETIDEAKSQALVRVGSSMPVAPGDEPPVVARLMVEIRSDGSRTIARGAVEDIASGERVAVEAHGATPAQLAASLARTVFAAPMLARAAFRAVLDGRRDPKGRRHDEDDG